MCGIVSLASKRSVASILVAGLHRLEYRGYDSAGLVVQENLNSLNLVRVSGKVSALETALLECSVSGTRGLAHTRWATHGLPTAENAHPHVVGDRIAVVHNGILENEAILKTKLLSLGYTFQSETDTEVIAVWLYDQITRLGKSLKTALAESLVVFRGAYALVVLDSQDSYLYGVRVGSPLVIGLGIDENYLASDLMALQPWVEQYIILGEHDIVEFNENSVNIYDGLAGAKGDWHKLSYDARPIQTQKSGYSEQISDKQGYRHFMLKEIFEQPKAVLQTFQQVVGASTQALFQSIQAIQIIACGTSYYAGYIAKYWLEKMAGVPCQVEIASEFRYREPVLFQNTLVICISQSGETADTLAVVKYLKNKKPVELVGILAICNVRQSTLVRESDSGFLTQAGPEIGVASTKAFTAQLAGLLQFVFTCSELQQFQKKRTYQINLTESKLVCLNLPAILEQVLSLKDQIKKLARKFVSAQHVLCLGRGVLYPIALEGALKIKELSYLHAEAYPAGELKHGPLALIDANMPVIVLCGKDHLLDKTKSNIREIQARGGRVFVFADQAVQSELEALEVEARIDLPSVPEMLMPFVFIIPLQLFAYYLAVLRGTDVDQPRNLAKSVTVE